VDSHSLKQMLDSKRNLILLDVRDEDKFQMGSLYAEEIQTLNVPFLIMREQAEPFDDDTSRQLENATIVTVCTTGNKAQKAAAFLREKGYSAVSLDGGLTAWNSMNVENE
jgi:rhodanese-related sulfurtransferase